MVSLKDLEDRLLYQPILYSGYAQQTDSTVGLGQLHSQHWVRTVRAIQKTAPQIRPVGLDEVGQFAHGHAVDPSDSLVGLHLAVGQVHVCAFHDSLHQELFARATGASFHVDSFAPSIRGQPC